MENELDRDRRVSAPFLDPLAALNASIERLRAEMPGRTDVLDRARRERVELAATDVLRALVRARRAVRDLEHEGIAALDEAMLALGSVSFVMRTRAGRAPATDAIMPAIVQDEGGR